MTNDIPVTEITIIETEKLSSDGKNPNKMTKTQLDALKKNIERYGFLVPIVVNKDYIIADGEHRWLAAKELGIPAVPIVKVDVDDVDRRIIRQVMNKLRGTHDFQMTCRHRYPDTIQYLCNCTTRERLVKWCRDCGAFKSTQDKRWRLPGGQR
jgi:hypothetical protein